MNNRELVVRVATDVMKWKFYSYAGWYELGMFEINSALASAPVDWSPDTDIAAAMLVLLKLEELEPTATIRLSNGDGDSCDVDILTDVFCELNAAHISLDGGLELLPLAICLAALKAVEAE